MINWFIISFQDANSTFILILLFFHDHLISYVTLILRVVLFLICQIAYWKIFAKVKINEHTLERTWTLLPLFILGIIAIPSIQALYFMEDFISPLVTMKTIGNQWYWTYEINEKTKIDSYMISSDYENRLLDVDNSLFLPYLALVHNLISSSDVIHSWAIPRLGVKVDAVPGRINRCYFIINNPGTFYGQCSEICGANHTFMPIRLRAISLKQFCTLSI